MREINIRRITVDRRKKPHYEGTEWTDDEACAERYAVWDGDFNYVCTQLADMITFATKKEADEYAAKLNQECRKSETRELVIRVELCDDMPVSDFEQLLLTKG